MNFRKIVAIVAAALMLFSILPISAMAAGEETITVTGTTGTLDGTASISWKGSTYQVINYKNTSNTAIRTSDSAHFRVYVGNKFTVTGGTMSQVVINCVSSYLINNSANTVNDGWTVSANGTAITYTATSGAATELAITIGKQSRVTSVVITPGTVVGADCDHESLDCGDTCPECEEYVKEHKFSNNCVAECENGCGTANPDYADHVYDGAYDVACNVCTATREVNFPAADSELTIPEADEIGLGMSHDTTTPGKYYITGTVESIVNTTYGNLYIQDDEGNKLYVYGTYDADGTNRFDAMTEKPEVGMTITVYGVIGNYNNASQMKNAWITEMEGGCEHEYEYDCSTTCSLCGIETRPEAVCETDAAYACQDGLCIYCGNDVAGLGHAYDDQWDPDCNYGCGETREVEERPEMTEATITFDADKTQRTEYDTTHQVWANGGLTVTNNKGASTSNVGDYTNPGRFYKSSDIIISFTGMTELVIDASGIESKYLWEATLDAASLTYTVSEQVYTIAFAEAVDSITLTTANQVRANSITAKAVKASEPECEHEYAYDCSKNCKLCGEETRPEAEHSYFYPCDPVCQICYEVTNPDAAHTIVHVEAVAPTCTAMGNIEYWYCSDCGGAWSDEACTQITNQMSVKLPMAEHEYFYPCDPVCMNCYEVTNPDAAHTIVHVEAVAPTCTAMGNIEYWYCSDCGGAWSDEACTQITNQMSVKLPMTDHEYFYPCDPVCMNCYEVTNPDAAHTIVHVEAVAPTCTAMGNIEYWYCSDCGGAWSDEACTQITNQMSVKLPMAEHEYFYPCDPVCMNCYEVTNPDAAHNVQHVEAKDATCTENGNTEYWYCSDCGAAWADEAQTQITNQRNVIVPAAGHQYFYPCDSHCMNCGENTNPRAKHTKIHVEAVEPTCTTVGNVEFWYCSDCGSAWLDEEGRLVTNRMSVKRYGDHTYDNDYDVDCNVCGAIRTVELPVVSAGKSVSADVNGLAFKFDVSVLNMDIVAGTKTEADYTNATVDGYKLVKMGAVVSNGVSEKDIEAVYLCDLEPDSASFAVRVINIPADKLDVEITAIPYVVIEIDGVEVTINGEAQAASYNVVLG